MSFWDLDTKTIDLGDGNSVTIRKMTFGDMAEIWADKTLFDGPVETSQRRFGYAMLKKSIQSWQGPGFEGRGVSADNIAMLPWQIVDQLIQPVVEFSILTEDEKKVSGADTN